MQTRTVGLFGIVMVGFCAVAAFAQQDGAARGGRGGAPAGGGLVSMPVLQPEPSDKAVIFSTANLEKRYAAMQAATPPAAWRIVDGGTRTVNIRIGTSDAAAVHPMTVEFWVIMKGTGTATTGGKLVDGKIIGGTDTIVGPGDVVYVPATVPHSLTAAQPVTYVTTRYDIVPK